MLTLPPDPYSALQVGRDAGLPEIRTAYRKLILKCHPDKIQDPLQKQLAQDEFQKVQSAYELLSSDAEKSRYDNMYKLNQLEKERAKMETSAPRSSRRDRDSDYHSFRVHVAEPRTSSYANSPFPSPSKGYAAGTPPSRSYEEVYTTYEPSHPPRKTASYESARGYKSEWEKPEKYERKSKKDDKKDREDKTRKEEKEKRKEAERKERDREREKEERREEKRKDKERAERKEKEKEERRREKEKDKKKVEQARKKEADIKAAQAKLYAGQKYGTAAYSSASEDETPKMSRRTSGTQQEQAPVATERERKYSETIEIAADYLAKSGAKVSINTTRPKPQATEHFSRHHAASIPMAAPTPPAVNSPFSPPPPQADVYDEEEPHRSSAKSSGRRADKSYKKQSARGSSRDPTVEYTHRPAPLQHSATMPIRSRQPETTYISRPVPSLNRAQTFQEPSSRYPRERSRSRNNRRYHSDDDDSDGGRHVRRGHSHRSPERGERGGTKIRYTVDPGKTSARQISSEDMSRHHKSSKSGYPTANTSARMDPEYSHYSTATPGKIRYAPTFGEEEVKYAPTYTSVREEPIYTY